LKFLFLSFTFPLLQNVGSLIHSVLAAFGKYKGTQVIHLVLSWQSAQFFIHSVHYLVLAVVDSKKNPEMQLSQAYPVVVVCEDGSLVNFVQRQLSPHLTHKLAFSLVWGSITFLS
jgi:hypothetical protein